MSLDDADRQMARERRSRLAKLLAILIPVVLLVLFFLANSGEIRIDFLVFTTTTSLFWIMLICSLLGGVVGFFIGRPGHRAFRRSHETHGGKDAADHKNWTELHAAMECFEELVGLLRRAFLMTVESCPDNVSEQIGGL
jgi:uncharacterized integral membrane protein